MHVSMLDGCPDVYYGNFGHFQGFFCPEIGPSTKK